jgi:hypothetical protein
MEAVVTPKRDTDVITGPTNPATNPPNPLAKKFPKYGDLDGHPGIVEIKPHSISGIKEGLEQLAKYQANKKKWWPAGANELKKTYLLTYTFTANPERGKSTFTGYLLEPGPGILTLAQNIAIARKKPKKKTGDTEISDQSKEAPPGKWPTTLDGYGTWWRLGDHQAPEHTFGEWRKFAGPSATGSMLEYPLKNEFVKAYGVPDDKHLTGPESKDASMSGADVRFLEIAEFLYELEAALARAA